VQVLLGAVLIDTLHAALEDRIVVFDRVRADVAAHVFFGAMVRGVMAEILATPRRVQIGLVSVDGAFSAARGKV
jgi:hypothetical protein